MAENVKGLAMRYKHDGVVYELDSGKLVHTKGEQSIDGKKVFKTVPQVESAPVEDNDVTNKKYVQDALDAFAAPKVASFTITATNSANGAQGAAAVEINKLKIFLADGRRLDPVFMEEGDLKGSTEAKLLVLTLNKQDQSDLTPTKVAKTEIESYALKDGEFLGKLYPCKFFGQHQDMYSNSDYQDPWNQYWTTADRFWNQENTTSGQVRIDIFDIDQMVQKLSFTSTSSGREAVFTATANDGAKEENGDVQKKENHVFDIVFPKMGEMLSKPGPVLLSTNQVVKDVKTFATPPKSANAPVANDDVANKAYVDNLNNELKGYVDGLIQKPGFDIELQIGVTALASWNAFSQLNILLNNGKRLEAKYVENGVKSGSDPAKVVLVMTDNPDAEIPEPELKQASFFDTYELGSNEYACDFYNATAMGLGTIHTDPRQANPWRAYLVNGISSGQKGYYLKLVIKQLQDAIITVQFYCGDKHNGYGYPPKNFIFKASCNGVTTDEQVSKDNPSSKELIKFDIPADALPMGDNYVDLVSEQTISGVKTFAAVPKITAEPTEDTDAVNKKYVEEHFVSRPPKYDFKIEITCEGNSSYVAYSELKINLTGGKVIEPLYLEKRETLPDNNIYRFVYKISDASAVTVKQTPRKSSSEMDAYQLQDGEYIGHLYYVGHLNSGCSMNAYDIQTDPWYGYLCNDTGSGKLTMCQIILSDLPNDVTGIQFKAGDKYNDFSYKSTQYGAKFTYGAKSQEHELINAQATHEFLVDSKALAPEGGNSGFVRLAGDQSINGVKTFNAAPKSLAEAVDGNDLITKDFATKNFFARENSARDYDILVKMKNDGTWVGFTQFKVLLSNGTRLDIKHLEDVSSTTATQPLVAVFKTVTDSAAAIEAPQRQAKTFFDSYQLEEGEYKGTVSFYKVVGKFNPAGYDINPWNVYVGNQNANTYDGIYGLHIEQLDKGLKGVNFKFGDAVTSWNYTCQQCGIVFTTDLGSLEVEYKGDMTDATEATIELPSDSDILGGIVTVEKDQSISGVKTFLTPPKSVKAPTDAKDIANKAYVDNRLGAGFDVTFTIKQAFISTWSGLSKLHVELAKGVLEAKYVEDVMPANAKEPALVVWTTKSTATKDPQVTYKSKEDIKGYELQDGEYLGDITYAELLGPYKSHTSTDYRCPFDSYLYNGGVLGQKPLIKVNIYSLKQAVKSVRYLNGYNGSSYIGSDHAVDFVVNNVESTSTLTGAGTSDDAPFVFTPTVKTLFDNEKSNYVPIKSDAIIFDKKTFTKKVFITDPDQASEMVTGQVATMESLKAVGLIGPSMSNSQLIGIWGKTSILRNDGQTLTAVMTGLKLFANDTELYLKHIETKTIDQWQTGWVRGILSKKQEWDPNSTSLPKKDSSFFDSYRLQPGEYLVYSLTGNLKDEFADFNDALQNKKINWAFTPMLQGFLKRHTSTAWALQATLGARLIKSYTGTMLHGAMVILNAPNITSLELTAGDGDDNDECALNFLNVYTSVNNVPEDINSLVLPRMSQLEQEWGAKSTKGAFLSTVSTAYLSEREVKQVSPLRLEFTPDSDASVEAPNAPKVYLTAVNTTNPQRISGIKTFAKSVSCEVAPTEDAHLTNKKYVDDELAKLAARIAALEAANP